MMAPGIHLDQKVYIQLLEQRVAGDAVRLIQMESAIQQLMTEKDELQQFINSRIPSEEVVDVASTDESE